MNYRDLFLENYFNEDINNLNNLDAMWRALFGDNPVEEGNERELIKKKFEKMKAEYEKKNGKYVNPEEIKNL